MPIIQVDHLTKEYRLGAMQGIKQTLLNTGARLIGKPVPKRPLFKALDDVSFSIEQGEVVGIIGHNGAGKSTLLKMLAKISTPTHGSVKVNGRIAPLIEVGAGFVPDFTGRENVYLNGAILGMSKQEIDQKFDEIVDFAEIAEFIDTPVKRYSSGMQVKLAFAVATSIESEILIVDEVLAVGDLAFQRKCFDRMEGLIRKEGRTILLVSHNIRQVQRLCGRTILLGHGKVLEDGPSRAVCEHFYAQSDEKIRDSIHSSSKGLSGRYQTTEELHILQTDILNADGTVTERLHTGDDLLVRIAVAVNTQLTRPVFAVGIHTTDFLYLGTERSEGALTIETLTPGIYSIECQFRNIPLHPGIYSIRVSIVAGEIPNELFYGENLAHFQIIPTASYAVIDMSGEGFIALATKWHLEPAEAWIPSHSLTPPTTSRHQPVDNSVLWGATTKESTNDG